MDLLVIAEPSDFLAVALARTAKDLGKCVRVMRAIDAARLFTINVSPSSSSVAPDVPMFLRLPPAPSQSEGGDVFFHYSECLSTLWAAGALSKSMVINRPGYYGFSGKISFSSSVTEQRAGLDKRRLEVFTKSLSVFSNSEQEWWLQSIPTGLTSCWPDIPEGNGPYRLRPACQSSGYEFVTVVGQNAWRATSTPLKHLSLEEKSVLLLQNLDLFFGLVSWSISTDSSVATIVKINPFPVMKHVQYVWSEVASALLAAFGL